MNHSSPTILVVDDDPALLEIIEIALRLNGMEILAATDARSALARADTTHWDAALIDVQMPHLDGWQLLAALKERAARPVVMMSGTASTAEAHVHGADGFIAKPFSIVTLIETIAGHVLTDVAVR